MQVMHFMQQRRRQRPDETDCGSDGWRGCLGALLDQRYPRYSQWCQPIVTPGYSGRPDFQRAFGADRFPPWTV